ncbi:hypothetical protein [Cypionkella sp. TWP1-2-1b2]|uniref:hypothetical protein n=1 Tax=Cypionkella sp. TWP1-2-1b2 TaxID=2804675 RepID=UPI003CF2610C
MRNLLLLLCLLASPAQAAISFDDLRALVLARDFVATDAALIAAHTEYTAAQTPDAERDLYVVFGLTDPAIGQFVLDWAENDPDNPRALTAKAWNLYDWGWILRGERTMQNTTNQAFAAITSRHRAAFPLFKRATELQPDLIPASDGLLRLTATLGNKSIIPLELERIMTSQPNRGSLMRAMFALAPQWNGRPEQVNLLCDRYAPKITDIKDYSPEVCRIDAVYYANFWYGDQRAAAHQLLMFTPNPVLDYARLNDLMDGLTSGQDAIEMLENVKAERNLTTREARKLDIFRNERNNVSPLDATFPEYRLALQRTIPELQTALAKDPLNPSLLHHYFAILSDAEAFANRPVTAAEKADLVTRLQATLKLVPTAPELWLDITELTLRAQDLDSIARAEPYFHNAIHYSLYDVWALSQAVRPKVQIVQDQNNLMRAADISDFTPEQLAKLDEIVNCPLAKQLSFLRMICENRGTPENQCGNGAATDNVVWDRLKDRINAGVCEKEFSEAMQFTYEQPAKVDF